MEGDETRHTVNVVFEVASTGSLDEQHDDWQLLQEPAPGFREYVRRYFERDDLLWLVSLDIRCYHP